MNTTKENISDALKRLLQKKSLAKVTIADITRECGVTRMTFYYHFTDINDLILWICENDKRVALEDIEYAGRWQEGFLSLLETARKNKSFVSNVCSNVDRKVQFTRDYTG
jgi:AcrR family transcriptional regulator